MKTYTFKVALSDDEGVWRKIELPASWTLEDLHYTIQDAFDFDAAHLYSFFMSGEAWDASTEYALTDEAEFDEDFEDDEDAAEWSMDDLDASAVTPEEEEDVLDDVLDMEAVVGDLTVDSVSRDGASANAMEMPVTTEQQPSVDDIRALLAELKNNPDLRAEMTRQISKQAGIPPAVADMVLSNADSLLNMLPDDMVRQLMGPMGGQLGIDDGEEPAGDVREVQRGQRDLSVGKSFLYVYDYGDEWEFDVQLEAINENGPSEDELPRLVDAEGEAPSQYEDDDEEDGEDAA
jgi:hypothetical protein